MSSEKYGRVAKGSRTTGIQRTFQPSLLLFLLAAYLAGIPVRAAAEYSLNQNFGSIAFSVSHLGLFSSQGEFRRFDAKLDFDDMHPERTHIVVDVDAASGYAVAGGCGLNQMFPSSGGRCGISYAGWSRWRSVSLRGAANAVAPRSQDFADLDQQPRLGREHVSARLSRDTCDWCQLRHSRPC
jgi:hypothetical protein